jgi:esterase
VVVTDQASLAESAEHPVSDPSAEAIEHLRLAAELSGLAVPEILLPAEHDVVLRGLRFRYLDWGSPGRTPMLFLHGGALTARTWDVVCLGLRAEYRCLALDLRGHGESDWSEALDYDIDSHAADLAAFAEALDLRGLVLVGQSLGGLSALLYASGRPARAAALVLVDAGPRVRMQGARRIADFILQTEVVPSLDGLVAQAHAFNPRRDPRLLRRSLLHNLRRREDGSWAWKYDRRHVTREWIETMVGRLSSLEGAARRVAVPALVVRGAQSPVLSDADARELAGQFASGRWEAVPDAGHNVQGDNPLGLVTSLRGFLRGIGLDRRPLG